MSKRLFGSLCWVFSIQYYAIQLVAAGAWDKLGFSWSDNTISDLGNTACGLYANRFVCSPLYLLMDISFVILGITTIAGAIAIGDKYYHRHAEYAGFACMIMSGVGTTLVGIFPENSLSAAHLAGAGTAFLAGNIGMILIGWRVGAFPILLRTYSILSGLVGLGGLTLFINQVYVGLHIGGMERIVAYPQSIFMIVIGTFLYTRQSKNTD